MLLEEKRFSADYGKSAIQCLCTEALNIAVLMRSHNRLAGTVWTLGGKTLNGACGITKSTCGLRE